MAEGTYDEDFFSQLEFGSRHSARVAIPLVLQYVRPASVVDVGCGIGTWLAEFQAEGITDLLGIDGEYVDRGKLLIDPKRFLARDLEQPLKLDRRFDLAVSLEVAEHLSESSADAFVASLVDLAPVVLFSAAIPHQGGKSHVNEQWPLYWHAKFAAHDYVAVDCLREKLWREEQMCVWYAQNAVFYVRRDALASYPLLAEQFARAGDVVPLPLVHPWVYLTLFNNQEKVISELRRDLETAQRAVISTMLKLREINLMVFPDWTLPIAAQREQIRDLCAATMAHPDASRMTLVAHLPDQAARDVLIRAADEARSLVGSRGAGEPIWASLDDAFAAWPLLFGLIQGRVALPHDNKELIARSAADALGEVTLATLRAGRPLPNNTQQAH